jgi:hypothetical protein
MPWISGVESAVKGTRGLLIDSMQLIGLVNIVLRRMDEGR